jgi:Ca2+:H+ antiporter
VSRRGSISSVGVPAGGAIAGGRGAELEAAFAGLDGDADPDGGGSEGGDGGLSFPAALLWLAFFGALVALVSEVLVGSLEGAAAKWGLGEAFISTIMLPIAGNAAEHYSAIVFAGRNRLDLSLGIAVGSSLQIFLFVLPLLVVIAWGSNQPLSLDLAPFEATTLIVSILVSIFLLLNGRSTWMSGATLIAAYFIVAVGFAGRENTIPGLQGNATTIP